MLAAVPDCLVKQNRRLEYLRTGFPESGDCARRADGGARALG